MSKFGRRIKHAPEGYEYIEPTIVAMENELRERVNEPHEGLRKNESQWPIHQINWQKSRYVYDMYYTYGRISKEVYDYCITNKIVDAQLIAKWKKPGYERLCSTYVINPRNYKFGTVSICRVPRHALAPGTEIEDPMTGCRGCASGSSANIFSNKYGQYLAAIQVAREDRIAKKKEMLRKLQEQDDDEEDESKKNKDDDDDEEDYQGPVGAPDGSSGRSKNSSSGGVWASSAQEEQEVPLEQEQIGELAPEANREGMQALSKQGVSGGVESSGPPGKRARPN